MTTYDVNVFLFYDGNYHQIPRDHVAAAGVRFARSVNEDLDLAKSSVSFRLLDDEDQYRPSNPAGPLYEIIGPYLPYAYTLGSAPRAAGELESLTPGETDGHQASGGVTVRGSRWVDVQAGDPFSSIFQWREPVTSPMRLHILGMSTMRGYWPGEDGAEADRMSAAYGAAAARVVDVEFASADGPPGSNKLLKLGAAGAVRGTFPSTVSTSGWQVAWCSDMNGADATLRPVFSFFTTYGYTYTWYASTTSYRLVVSQLWGADLLDTTIGNGGTGPGADVVTRLKCSRSGSTWTVEMAWWKAGTTVLIGSTSTFTGATHRPASWQSESNTVMNGGYLGHVFVCTGTSEDLQSNAALDAINGYPDETTAERFVRLLQIRRIPREVLGTLARAARMGYQRPGSMKAQLQEIARTEQGLIFPSRDGRGLVLALRDYLYTQCQAPALELTWPDDTGPIAEQTTAAGFYNQITAEDRSGSSVTAVQPDGRYGTAEPPTGSGIIDRTVEVNYFLADDIQNAARSWLRFHQDPYRLSDVTVDVDAVPGLRTDVEAIDLGMAVRVTGRTPDPVVLLVTGISGADRIVRHVTTFGTAPAGPFQISAWGDGVAKWGLSSCTLSSARDEDDTSLTLTITEDEAWSTTPGYSLMISGERVVVTAMGARTGSLGAYQQVATVTRSANGIVKPLAAGARVTVANMGRWGW